MPVPVGLSQTLRDRPRPAVADGAHPTRVTGSTAAGGRDEDLLGTPKFVRRRAASRPADRGRGPFRSPVRRVMPSSMPSAGVTSVPRTMQTRTLKPGPSTTFAAASTSSTLSAPASQAPQQTHGEIVPVVVLGRRSTDAAGNALHVADAQVQSPVRVARHWRSTQWHRKGVELIDGLARVARGKPQGGWPRCRSSRHRKPAARSGARIASIRQQSGPH